MASRYDPALLQKLCEQASKETDTEKLLELTRKISEELDKKPPAGTAGGKAARREERA
jgi:hypothetical protein